MRRTFSGYLKQKINAEEFNGKGLKRLSSVGMSLGHKDFSSPLLLLLKAEGRC